MRHILAISSGDSAVFTTAAQLAERDRARLTVIEAWQEPLLLWGIGASWYTFPFSSEQALAEVEAAAAERVRGVCKAWGPGLVAHCRRGGVLSCGILGVRSGMYDVVVVPRCSRSWHVLRLVTKLYGVQLVGA